MIESRTRRWLVVGAVGLTVVVGGLLWVFNDREPAPPIPRVDIGPLDPQVQEELAVAISRVERAPGSGAAWGHLGMVYLAHEFPVPARDCFEQALERDADNARWPYFLGHLQARQDPAAAAGFFRQAAERNPESRIIAVRLGEVLLDGGELEQARAALEQALQLTPAMGRAEYRRAQLSLLQDELEESVRWGEQATELAPGHREIWELLAMASTRLNDRTAAAEFLNRARTLETRRDEWTDPFLAEVARLRRDRFWQVAHKQFFAAGRETEGLRMLEMLVDQYPDEVSFPVRLAQYHIAVENWAAATEVLDHGLEQHPDSPDLNALRGAAYLVSSDWSQAVRHLRRALQGDPDLAAVHADLAYALEQLEQPDEALAEWREAVRFAPAVSSYYLGLARLQLKLGQRAECRETLVIAEQLDPENSQLRELTRQLDAAP